MQDVKFLWYFLDTSNVETIYRGNTGKPSTKGGTIYTQKTSAH